jgi:hypothetical protein
VLKNYLNDEELDQHIIHVQVFDQDYFNDNLIGKVEIPLRQIYSKHGKWFNQFYQLKI